MNDFEKIISCCKFILYNKTADEVAEVIRKTRRTVQAYRNNPHKLPLECLERLYLYYIRKHQNYDQL